MKKQNIYKLLKAMLIYIIAVVISFLWMWEINASSLSKALLIGIISLLLWFIMYNCIILCNYKKKHIQSSVPVFLYFFNVIDTIVIFCIFTRKEVLYGSHGQLIVLCVGGIFCLYGNICIIRLQRIFGNEKEINRRLQEMHMKIKEFHNEYSKIMKCKETIGYMRHDIANHIAVVESILPENSMKVNYLRDIKKSIQKTEEIKYCNNQMLDAAFEKKIRQLEEKGLRVDTDIRIKDIENIQCEKLCLLMWMLIDNAANYMVQNEKILIKVFENTIDNEHKAISFLIKGYSEKLNQHIMKAGMEMKIIEYLIDSMDGSILIADEGNCTAEAGMVEARYIND